MNHVKSFLWIGFSALIIVWFSVNRIFD
jgi:hypothetical protein